MSVARSSLLFQTVVDRLRFAQFALGTPLEPPGWLPPPWRAGYLFNNPDVEFRLQMHAIQRILRNLKAL